MQLLEPGSEFASGRYEIVRVLSAGGMGVVYEVLQRDTKRHRALKLMLPQLLLDDDMRARFTREGIVTAGIESEHLVEVFDVGIDQQTRAPFLVMELLRGEDLGARLTRGERTKPAEVIEIVTQIARALDKTHKAGIVHRDLKPENLFVTERDDGSMRMRILDFGIAKLIEKTGVARGKDTRSVGTPLYMAPEQMTGHAIDIGPAADVYALGHIAFTLLVGSPYFRREAETADNVLGLMFKVSGGTVDRASLRAELAGVELPSVFDPWFWKATKLEPAQRYPSAGELLRELKNALAGAPEVLPTVASARRKVAFSATVPIESAADGALPASGAGVAPTALTPVPHLQTRPSESGAAPSSRTLATASEPKPKSRTTLILVGAVGAAAALGLGVYALIGDQNAADTPVTGVATNVGSDTKSATATATGPSVTLGAIPSASAAAPESASATAVASAQPSVSASATAPVKTPPRQTATAPVTAVPTMWGGPRR